MSISRHKQGAAIFTGEEMAGVRCVFRSTMGGIFSGTGKVNESFGGAASSVAIELAPQYFSRRNHHSNTASWNCPFVPPTAASAGGDRQHDRAATGLVTFYEYEYSRGGKAFVRSAGMTPQALQAGRAGKRVADRDAQEIQAPKNGPKAGCDAGKGAVEPAAGSLAWRNTPGSRAAAYLLPWRSAMEAREAE